MATSGSVDFSVSRANLIEDALNIVGGLGVGDTIATVQTTHANRQLNMILKSWISHGIQLWSRSTGYVLPFTGASSTTLGPSGGHATLSYVQTTLSAAAADGATTIVVTSATGISNTYNIGIEQDDDTMHWTTVNGAPSGTTVTLTAALTDSAASGNYVYVYQTKLVRPTRVIAAYIHQQETDVDYPINVLAFDTFSGTGDNDATGVPVQVNYDPQLTTGTFRIYPQFDAGRHLIKITFQRPLEDFDADADTPDLPQEGYLALMYALAVVLAPTYGMPVQDRGMLKADAKEAFEVFKGNEPEEGSLQIQPDLEC